MATKTPTKKIKRKVGRPTGYSQKLADTVCARLSEGESMRTIALDSHMPALSTLFKWLREHKEFSEQYARAKQESADAMAEEIMDIADDGRNDWVEKERKDGTTFVALDSEHVQRSRLRIDTRKWLMAKMKPKKYGEKVDVTSDGEKVAIVGLEYVIPNAPITDEIETGTNV